MRAVVSLMLPCVAFAGCLVTIDESLIDGDGGGSGGGTAATGMGGGMGPGGADGGAGGAGGGGGGEQPGPARILYSDLQGGPNTGGENDAGAYVTLYGKGFGGARGNSYVTIGGGAAAAYPVWSDTKLTFQIGAAARSGDIVVHVEGSGYSNGVAFDVRPGKIYFADPLGDDTNGGATPDDAFETITHCLSVLAPGGICYASDVLQELDTDGAALVLPPSSQASAPKALIAYPGTLPRIESAAQRGVVACNDAAGCADDGRWVLGGLRVEAPALALDADEIHGLRVVGSHLFCGSTTQAGDCVRIDQGAGDVSLLGNLITVTEAPGGATSSAVHVGDGVSGVDLGWNDVSGPAAWSGVRVDGGGALDVHDNIVTDVGFRGLDFTLLDQNVGPTALTNNVIAFAGDGTETSACIAFTGTLGFVSVALRHNTLYDCGSPGGSNVYMGGPPLDATNNVFAQPDATRFVTKLGFGPSMTGTNNVFFGDATMTGTVTENDILGDPSFSAVALRDFHLLPGSAAIDAGSTSAGVSVDRDGRPRDATPDVGAYEAD